MTTPERNPTPRDVLTAWRGAEEDLARTARDDPRRGDLAHRVDELRRAYRERLDLARAEGAVPGADEPANGNVAQPGRPAQNERRGHPAGPPPRGVADRLGPTADHPFAGLAADATAWNAMRSAAARCAGRPGADRARGTGRR